MPVESRFFINKRVFKLSTRRIAVTAERLICVYEKTAGAAFDASRGSINRKRRARVDDNEILTRARGNHIEQPISAL